MRIRRYGWGRNAAGWWWLAAGLLLIVAIGFAFAWEAREADKRCRAWLASVRRDFPTARRLHDTTLCVIVTRDGRVFMLPPPGEGE